MSNNFLIVITFMTVFYSGISSIKFSGQEDALMRESILDALKQFHNKYSPLTLDVPAAMEHESCDSVLLPSLNYFDFKSISNLSSSESENDKLVSYCITLKIQKFNPYLVTSNSLLNAILYAVLKDNFHCTPSMDFESFHDELLILTAKFVYNLLDFDKLPRNMYFYVLSLMHEIAYGIDATVPVSFEALMMHALRVWRFHELPRFWGFAATSIEGSSNWVSGMNAFYSNFIASDINANPSGKQLKESFTKTFFFQIFVAEMYPDDVTDFDDLIDSFEKCRDFDVSSDVFDLYLSSQYAEPYEIKFHKSNSLFAKKMIAKRGDSACFDYFWTRNSVDQFDLAYSAEDPQQVMLKCTDLSSPSVAHLDAFAQLVRYSGADWSNVLSALLSKFSNPLYVEIIMKESVVPVVVQVGN
jgi:hypothetical protein